MVRNMSSSFSNSSPNCIEFSEVKQTFFSYSRLCKVLLLFSSPPPSYFPVTAPHLGRIFWSGKGQQIASPVCYRSTQYILLLEIYTVLRQRHDRIPQVTWRWWYGNCHRKCSGVLEGWHRTIMQAGGAFPGTQRHKASNGQVTFWALWIFFCAWMYRHVIYEFKSSLRRFIVIFLKSHTYSSAPYLGFAFRGFNSVQSTAV